MLGSNLTNKLALRKDMFDKDLEKRSIKRSIKQRKNVKTK